MKKLVITALAFASLVTSTAFAAAWSTNTVYVKQIEVDSVPAASGGTLTYVVFDVLPTGRPAACAANGWAELSGSLDNVKAMTSIATAAMLAKRPVAVYWDGTCNGAYARIKHFRMN